MHDLRELRTALTRDLTTGILVDAATAWRTQVPDVVLAALPRREVLFNYLEIGRASCRERV